MVRFLLRPDSRKCANHKLSAKFTKMRKVTLSLEQLGNDSRNFLTLLSQKKTLDSKNDFKVADDVAELTVTFRGLKPANTLGIKDVATLALLIRHFAESGRYVKIIYPALYHGSPSRIHAYLERIGFTSLFSAATSSEPWQKNVTLQLPSKKISAFSMLRERANFIELRWFGEADFDYDREVSIWKAHPRIKPHVDRQFRRVLQSQGFADLDTIDLLTKTIFLEIAWNTVLHSRRKAGSGVGVICGQIDTVRDGGITNNDEVIFCIADLGRGIPESLRAVYRSDTNWRDYHSEEKISEESAIVRYALDSKSTSRPELPSEYDKAGFRGLALVASALQNRGDMLICSDGGAVRLEGKVDGTLAIPTDQFAGMRFPGVQVIGHLQKQKTFLSQESAVSEKARVPDFAVHLVSEVSGECSALASAEAAKSFVQACHTQKQVAIYDLGYSDTSSRSLEYLCKSALPNFLDRSVIFWNVATPWSQFSSLKDWIKRQGTGVAVFVRAQNDVRCYGYVRSLRQAWLLKLIDNHTAAFEQGTQLSLAREEFLRLAFAVNTLYLSRGFDNSPTGAFSNVSSGFFSGKIHLLRGGAPTSRYFSLTTNLSVGRGVNLRRWVEGCVVAVQRLLERTSVLDERLVLLGFTGTMREVVAQVYLRLNRSCRAYMLLTFDIPTKEEIASKVQLGDRVLLITDVISTGTLVEAVTDLVRRVGGEVVGCASLADARGKEAPTETIISLGSNQIPLVTCSAISLPEQPQTLLGEAEYWVDPVSLVPSTIKAWGWAANVDEKVEKTIALISAANAASCGHIVDGTRHTSVYIDLQRLLETHDLVLQVQIASICAERLQQRGWSDFNPTLALFPSGISRIESVPRESRAENKPEHGPLTVYRTAVQSYAERLRRIWKSVTPLEVQRAFDPGGGSRCASTVSQPNSLEGNPNDVIVTDDGVWRGTTVNALIQIACSLGAKRVLVVPLLARLSPSVAGQLEQIHSIQPGGQSPISVCYAFPLLLPIPYYGAQECPYEVTIKRIQDRHVVIESLRKIGERLIRSLSGRPPSQLERPAEFSNTWLRLRTYLELASEHEGFLEKLNAMIEKTDSDGELLALFLLFSEEWHLLGRARLRQNLRSIVRARAEQVAISDEIPSEVRIAALTVLRSLFSESFVDILPSISRFAREDPDLLCRISFQVATLGNQLRRRKECLQFLEDIDETASSAAGKNKHKWNEEILNAYFEALMVCKSLSVELKAAVGATPQTKREAALQLYRFLSESDRILKHRLRPFLEILANSEKSIHDLDAGNFRSLANEWKGEHEPVFAKELLPCLSAIHHLLLRAGTQGHHIVSEDLRFLEDRAKSVQADLVSVSSGLDLLQQVPENAFFKRAVVLAAQRLTSQIVGAKSTTIRLLDQIRGATIRQILDNFEDEICAHFAAMDVAVRVTCQRAPDINETALVFAPLHVITLCTGNILDNLVRYAFPIDSLRIHKNEPMVELSLRRKRSDQGETMVTLLIKNNGLDLKAGANMGDGGRRAAAALQLFGGEYALPERETELRWTVVHQITVLLW